MSLPRNGFRRSSRGSAPQAGSTRLTRYVTDGRVSIPDPGSSVADGLAFARSAPSRMALFLYAAPTPEEIAELASAWDLHPVLVEDLVHAGQRPKLERYGEVMFLVIRSAHYVDEEEEVDFAEFHVLMGPGAVAVLCQDGPSSSPPVPQRSSSSSPADPPLAPRWKPPRAPMPGSARRSRRCRSHPPCSRRRRSWPWG